MWRLSPILGAVLGLSALSPLARSEGTVDGLRGTQGAEADQSASLGGALSCPGYAALFTSDKGLKLWVLRRGTMTERNPLRPLSQDSLLVMDVVVNGRSASAYGPDPLRLQQGGAVPEIERQNGPISWRSALDVLPPAIRVVASDGTVLVGPMTFVACGDAPKVQRGRDSTARNRTAPKAGGATSSVALPQGAIP